ncbi:glycosyltransferase family 2 protein [Streptomyces sp. NPDC049555]|uniref:glycosyltransferase family 2 protein n=1 Tax=Streptomyces sp. NPDC049555 TaxID=3154930 RepID=UPI003424CAAE
MAVNGSGIPGAQVSVVVIGYDDAAHIADAVRSALGQGPAVAEVIAVDDASTDRTGPLLDRLATGEPRLRVVHRPVNSGGCGTPRNDGVRAATAPYVMFLDSDDVLPHGAVPALLAAALEHEVPVAAGLCVRRELPLGRDTPWQPQLYRRAVVHDSPEDHPALVRDTLCVNKLYARAFLTRHGIVFPDGHFPYEDFVFGARLLAAGPRLALVPDTVYVWHVRRNAARASLSLDRRHVENWQARLRAHRQGVAVLAEAGRTSLAHAARVKFLDHDLRMYVRELPGHGPAYRRAWWRVTRDWLAGCEEADLRAARAPARWIARVVLASPAPRDLDRLAQLAARPARLLPPYAEAGGEPVWAADLSQAALDGLTGPGAKPARRLPVTVDATLLPGPGLRAGLRLRVHEIYGRLAAANPHTADVELRLRDGAAVVEHSVPLARDGACWRAALDLDLGQLAVHGHRDGPDRRAPAPQAWDVRVRIHCTHGGVLRTAARAVDVRTRPCVRFGLRCGVLLAQPCATGAGSLALRLAPGVRCGAGVVLRRVRRMLVRRLPARRPAAAGPRPAVRLVPVRLPLARLLPAVLRTPWSRRDDA